MARDAQVLMLRGSLAEAEQKLEKAEDRFRNAVDAVRTNIVLWETPDEVDMGAVNAAIEDMASEQTAYVKTQKKIADLKSRLGMD